MSRFETCPCCDGAEFYSYYSNPDCEPVTTAQQFAYGGSRYISRLVKCRSCAYGFSDDACAAHASFYCDDQTTVVSDVRAGKMKYFSSVIKMTAPILSQSVSGKRLLDIGAGNGAFISQLLNEGFTGLVDAVEMNPQSQQDLLPNVRRVYSTIDDIDETANCYDVITLFDFLEHVENPKAFLSGLAKISHADTVYVIGVPRMDSLLAKILGHRYWLYTPMHYSYFSRPSLQALLASQFQHASIRKSPWETGPLSSALKWFGLDFEIARDRSITVPHASSYLCVCSKRIVAGD
jgi:SAM-dependent methyltransferase